MPSESEVAVLKQARVFRDMLETEGWKEYTKILSAQINAREEVIHCPIHALPPTFVSQDTDLASKAAAVESAKGAIIGLKVALTIPSITIESAKQIAESSKEKSNG